MRKQPWNNRLLFLCPFFKKGTGKMELLILIISILAFLLELFVFWSCMMAGRALDEEMKCYEYEKEKKHKKKLPDKLAGSGKRKKHIFGGRRQDWWSSQRNSGIFAARGDCHRNSSRSGRGFMLIPYGNMNWDIGNQR